MGASVELRVRGEASLLQRARTCDNRRRGGSGDDGGNGGRAMTTWERGQQFDSLLGVLVLLMLWERCGRHAGAKTSRGRARTCADCCRGNRGYGGVVTVAEWRRWHRGRRSQSRRMRAGQMRQEDAMRGRRRDLRGCKA